jgi:hypothetical protein
MQGGATLPEVYRVCVNRGMTRGAEVIRFALSARISTAIEGPAKFRFRQEGW